MNKKQLGIVFGILGAVVLVVVVLLVTGGTDRPTAVEENPGDVIEREGEEAPKDTALADIQAAEVRLEGDQIILEATLGAEIPRKVKGGSFDLRWDIQVANESVYMISGNLDLGPNVSIVGLTNDFGSSSLDESLPGELEIEGDTWIIRINPAEIPDFPSDFQWKLTTTLDGKAGDPQSGVAEDTAPDVGFGEVLSG